MAKITNILMKRMIDAKNDLIMLTNTKIIQDSDLIHFTWELIKESYNSIENNSYDPLMRAVVSCLNAAIHHNKIAFAITKKHLQKLIREDMNYVSRQGQAFDNNKYSSVIKYMVKTGIFEILPGTNENTKTPLGMVIKLPEILEYMKVDVEQQKEELRNFLDNNKNISDVEAKEVDQDIQIIDNTPIQTPHKKENDDKICFSDLLSAAFSKRETNINFKLLENIIASASINCSDFENDIFTVNTLVTHFFGKKQKSKAQKNFRDKIFEEFQSLLNEHFAKDLNIKVPQPVNDDAWEEEHTEIMKREILQRYKERIRKKKEDSSE